ncbi:hypothetical protein EJ04DRAFT_59193 [Polyplosphaeria fusca]|uniref:Uncharacterized protein n=1 Tax=Polyplosphaeria fusca TaxID=682080 RepID=A0A9P4QLX5_9PLEO|nr:hypothetical protein EJ04DRAFT_59193 [Polyplosphaeria fusca]
MASVQSDCRQLCQAVYTKLPRELRDEVYQYLWSDLRDRQWVKQRLSLWSSPYTYCLNNQRHIFFDPDYMGIEVARESLDTLNRCFHISPLIKADQNISLYLNTDVFGLGAAPKSAARQIGIRIDLHPPEPAEESETKPRGDAADDWAAENFAHLLEVEQKSRLRLFVGIWIWGRAVGLAQIEKMMAILRPVLTSLRDDAAETTIRLSFMKPLYWDNGHRRKPARHDVCGGCEDEVMAKAAARYGSR